MVQVGCILLMIEAGAFVDEEVRALQVDTGTHGMKLGHTWKVTHVLLCALCSM
jgi:hypothetical protein